ncbi:hypothetical protein MPC4_20032 [Methylocella tundrae]|uniref:Uncharacterized protein n=1 Tax=Methylocella tundrae TaxID=227605 RepID=A0A8B6M6W5_METTU|nr:hypothetical protein MPC4_20032 [Methylocella tundrae]
MVMVRFRRHHLLLVAPFDARFS